MCPVEIEQTLAQIEVIFGSVSDAIGSGDPDALVNAATSLKNAAVDFSRLLDQADLAAVANVSFKLRIKNLSEGFSIQRENLIKRSVPVSQALGILVPASRASTYQPSPSEYGKVHAQSGEFRVIKA